MSLTLYEINSSINDARRTIENADESTERMCRLIIGRLKHVNSPYLLKQIKKELRDYNMHTGEWK